MISYTEKDKQKIEQAQKAKDVLQKHGISFCLSNEERYPRALRKLPAVPPVIYYKGNIEIVNHYKNLAVIGSRKFSDTGAELSFRSGQEVARAGLNLVNGLAIGCDTEAIKGALSKNGKCVAVMPCGLEQIQPKSNTKLAEEILEKGGCLLSEYPIGTEIQRYRYVERDRLQSGISEGVLIIEAERSSGTMHTVDFAIRQYKRLACYEAKILEMISGNKYLEETGKARALKSIEDLQEFITGIKKEEKYEQLSLFDAIVSANNTN